MTASAPTPAMLAAAWRAFRGDRPGMLLGPGPGFMEAIGAALSVREDEMDRMQLEAQCERFDAKKRVEEGLAAVRAARWRAYEDARNALYETTLEVGQGLILNTDGDTGACFSRLDATVRALMGEENA